MIALGLLALAAALTLAVWSLIRDEAGGGRDRLSYRGAKHAVEAMIALVIIGILFLVAGVYR